MLASKRRHARHASDSAGAIELHNVDEMIKWTPAFSSVPTQQSTLMQQNELTNKMSPLKLFFFKWHEEEKKSAKRRIFVIVQGKTDLFFTQLGEKSSKKRMPAQGPRRTSGVRRRPHVSRSPGTCQERDDRAILGCVE